MWKDNGQAQWNLTEIIWSTPALNAHYQAKKSCLLINIELLYILNKFLDLMMPWIMNFHCRNMARVGMMSCRVFWSTDHHFSTGCPVLKARGEQANMIIIWKACYCASGLKAPGDKSLDDDPSLAPFLIFTFISSIAFRWLKIRSNLIQNLL